MQIEIVTISIRQVFIHQPNEVPMDPDLAQDADMVLSRLSFSFFSHCCAQMKVMKVKRHGDLGGWNVCVRRCRKLVEFVFSNESSILNPKGAD